MNEFDYVVVGAGSAGCVISSRLTEDPSVTVCTLEAGPPDRSLYIHLPVGWMKLMRDPKHNWMYEAEPSEWTGGRRVPLPRGRTLGGSSSINGCIINRGEPGDFDHWAQRGNAGWGYADVLPLFKRLEDWVGEDPDGRRGRGGPLKVTPSPWRHPLCDAFLDACEAMGIPRNPDYNGVRQEGASYTQRNISGRWRMSAARAWLHPAMKRGNLEVRTETQAMAVLFEGRRAVGVRVRRGGKVEEIRARREVILCGGAVNSPQLLQLSGVGDPEHLRAVGIEVRHALPGVGENLRDHYTPRFTARAKGVETYNERVRWPAFGMELAKWAAGRPSVLNVAATACYAFARSDPALEVNDLQITFMPASYKEGRQDRLDDEPGMTIAAWQQRPESRGYVRAKSADPFEKPAIDPRYLTDEGDRRVLLKGLKLARAILRAEPMAPYFDRELWPGDGVSTDEELLETAKARGTTTFHLMGTCRMGPEQDPTAVVDARLRVRGLEGLRVIDASVMPTMPSANTNAATLMIAEKGSDMIREDARAALAAE